MQARKLLTRSKTVEKDSRVAISRQGRELLEAARPVHAASVRRRLLSRLTGEQTQAIIGFRLQLIGDSNR
jgi:hypothetical protein